MTNPPVGAGVLGAQSLSTLPSGATIDDLCRNLVLAIPALLDALDAHYVKDGDACQYCDDIEDAEQSEALASAQAACRQQQAELVTLRDRVAQLTAQLEADPCP